MKVSRIAMLAVAATGIQAAPEPQLQSRGRPTPDIAEKFIPQGVKGFIPHNNKRQDFSGIADQFKEIGKDKAQQGIKTGKDNAQQGIQAGKEGEAIGEKMKELVSDPNSELSQERQKERAKEETQRQEERAKESAERAAERATERPTETTPRGSFQASSGTTSVRPSGVAAQTTASASRASLSVAAGMAPSHSASAIMGCLAAGVVAALAQL